jgi:drug/metabolite transporter (DMT)-like permease
VTTVSEPRRTAILAAAALVAFASNSVLCRLALRGAAIDAATFTAIRIVSGAVMLLAVTAQRREPILPLVGTWTTATLLALYAVPFALAYTWLSTGTGALILFGSVQVTMLAAAVASGDRPRPLQWIGAAIALSGLVYLVFPGLAAPPAGAAALMTVAGIAWGFYSIRGRSLPNPLRQTTGNFVRAVPYAVGALLAFAAQAHASAEGVALALTSGAVASGLGYIAWYAALPGLSAMHAGVVQLAGPILAGLGGVILLGEPLTLRLALSAAMVLGGILLAIVGASGRRRSAL